MGAQRVGYPAQGRRVTRIAAIAAPAALALVLATVRNIQIPFWRDEFATAMFASLSPSDLLVATTHVDGVLAPYYLLMHFLSPALGLGPGMRIVSIFAFAATAAVIAVVALRWWGVIGAAAAGLAFALNGDVLGVAVNARPYALSLLCAALAILFASMAVKGQRLWPWVGYSLAGAAAVALQLFAVLPIAVIAALVAGRPRATVIKWAVASLPAAALATVLLAVGLQHRGQLSWLGKPDVREAIVTVARMSGVTADRAVAFDAVALALAVSAAALSVVAASRTEHGEQPGDGVRTRVFSAGLMLAPPLALFALSWAITPVFTGKYVIWSSVGAALLLGGCLSLIARPRTRMGVAAGALATALLVLAASATCVRLVNPPPRGDDFPSAVRVLETSAEVGDTLVIAQPYAFGGVAYGLAVSAGDDDHMAEVTARAISGSQPVLDVRTITSLTPLRSGAEPPPGRDSETDEDTWVMTIFPLDESQIMSVGSELGACLETMDFEAPAARYGALRLFHLDCD